jgi:hypothetical protein
VYVDPLIPKLVVTSVLIAFASLVQRRWGHTMGGVIASLPLTSGPLLLYLALDHGAEFAATAARGSFVALISFTAYAFGYAYAARRCGWKCAVMVAVCCFLAVAATLVQLAWLPAITAALVLPTVVMALRYWPRSTVDNDGRGESDSFRWWETPMRVLVAVTVTAGLTQGAPMLGAELTGLLGMFPIFSCVLATSTHHRAGPAAATGFLRSVVVGQPACLGFFLVLITTLQPWGAEVAFSLAFTVTLVLQFGARLALGRRHRLACALGRKSA